MPQTGGLTRQGHGAVTSADVTVWHLPAKWSHTSTAADIAITVSVET